MGSGCTTDKTFLLFLLCLLHTANPPGTYLLVSFEVNLLKRLVEPRLRVCDNGVASWDRLGEAGGPL